MEKIRKALDRARDERLAAQLTGTTKVVDIKPNVPPDTVDFTYSSTRGFKPDPKILEANRVLDGSSVTPVAAAFRMLRTQVVQRITENRWRSIAIISPGAGDGRTLTAINLAVMLATDPRFSVLLCDLDLRAPGVARTFGLEVTSGVDDILRGRATVAECLVHPVGYERLVLLPAREQLARSSEHLASTKTVDLVAELKGRYPDRVLIFDLPPVLVADDALAFASYADCGLLVVSEGRTRREDVVQTMEIMHKTPIVGSLLTRSNAPQGTDI